MKYIYLFFVVMVGNVKEKVAPRACLLFLPEIDPPCASIIFFDMNRPKPMPLSDIAENF